MRMSTQWFSRGGSWRLTNHTKEQPKDNSFTRYFGRGRG